MQTLRTIGLCALLLLWGCSPESGQPGEATASFENPSTSDLLPPELELLWQPWTGDFAGMVERRIVRVAVPYGGYQFYYDQGVPRGATYDLVQRFEAFLNEELARRHIRVHVITIPVSRDQLIPSLLSGSTDLVAGDLTITAAREQLVDFSKPLLTGVNEIVVTGPASGKLDQLDDLAGESIFLRRSSSYFEHLQILATDMEARGLEPPDIRLADELLEAEDVLELLDAGLITTTILDDYKAEFWANVFSNISPRNELVVSHGGSIAWAMRKNSPELAAIVGKFLDRYGLGTLVGNDTYNRYLADAERIRCASNTLNYARVVELANHFQRFGEQYGFEWLMLGAQGLQESGLRQDRRSSAGAVGIMQIKPSTAADKNVGIRDVSTAENNIHAGAKYLRFIADRYFTSADIDPLNQWFFSLAAYNAGPARVGRLRREALRKGYDPNVWFDNVEIIAAQRIGRETVAYVSNIFKYYVGYQLTVGRSEVRDERFADALTACADAR